jgi:methylthioxylose transferase
MARHRIICAAILLTALLSAVAIGSGVAPLGVPGEWEWRRIAPAGDTALGLLSSVIAAAAFLAFAWAGSLRIDEARRAEACAWVAGLACAAFGWLWVAQEAAPAGYGLSKSAWVLYYPGSSGYFTQARYGMQDTAEFLRDYEHLMSQGDVLHIGTHPPGLTVGYRLLMDACRRFPAAAAATLSLQPESVQESFAVLEANTRRTSLPLATEDRAVLWIAALAMQAFAAATVIPLFGTLRQIGSRGAAWRAAAFWPAVPAVCVFLPKADAMYPFWGMLFVWLWHAGLSRRSLTLCFAAGVALWTGLFMTLAFLPCILFAAVRSWRDGLLFPLFRPGSPNNGTPESGDRPLPGSIPSIAVAALGFCAPVVALYLAYDLNLIATWLWNFRNHAEFYSQYQRTYWKWLLVNPLEMGVAAGTPLTLLAAWSAARLRRCPSRTWTSAAAAAGVTWCALLLSGKNMGEAARLWILLMPWLILVAAPLLETKPPEGATVGYTPLTERLWLAILGGQFAFCTIVTACVVGFHPS